MTELEQKVEQESARFRAALPELLKRHAGQWVVFKDGQVQSAHDDDDEAYVAAVRRFGSGSGFLIAQVVEDEGPIPVTAGVYFGLFST